MASERAWTGRTPAATAGRSVASGRDRWCESARSVRGGVKTKVVTSDGGRARRAVRIVGAASARDEDEDEDDERRDERFRESIAFGGGRREVAFSFDVDDVNEEDDDVVDAGRRPGAGKVGMAGFDGYPGFASFAWMTEAAYEEYEDSHDHDDDDDDEMEEAIAESVVVSQAKTTDETTVTTTVTTTSTETSKTTSSTIGATRVGELARGLVSDTETKVIYAGVATAAALLGAKSFGGGKVCPPPATGAQTSTVGEKRPRDENVDKMAKPTEDTQIKDSRTGKVMSLPSGVTKVAAVAGVLSAASTVAIASGASLPRFGGGGGSTKSKAKGSGGSIIRLERLRQSMILEFEDEMAKLGRMEVEKNNELKTLNDNFKRSLTGVKLGSLRDEALSGAADGDEQNQQLQKVIAEMERHHQDEIKAKEAAFAAQAETLKASIAKLQNALNVAESALREAEEVNKSMMSQHEVELRAARGLIRAERELGRSEANKYRAARDLERVHVVNLRSALALAKVTSGERLTFLEDQLKAICSSYSARIIRERAEFAAKLEEARSATNADAKPSPRQIEDTSTARDEFASKIAEVRAEADAEISNLLAKHASAMRSASGERRALKVLYESEMRKGAAEKTRSEDPIIAQLRGEIAAREVAISAQQNDAIRDAQIDFEKRVVALKNAHKAEIEQLRVSASRDGSSDRIRALEEAHQMSIKATAEAHARALEDAEAEASKRVAEAEDRARDAIAKLDAGEAAKAQILAQFDAERTDIANQLQSEQLKGTEDIESMRAQYEEMLVRAVAQVQGVANDEKEKLEASIRELQERVAADKTELDRLQEQVAGKGADLSAEIGQLQKQLDERAEIERDLRGQIAAAKQTMLSSGAESDSEREALRAQVTRLEAQLADMKKSKEQYDATIESLKQSASSGAADRNATSQTDAQIGALKQQLEEQSRLLEDQKLYAEEQLVEAVAELKSENEMLTAKLRASSATTTSVSASQLNDAVRDAQIAFEQRVVALKKVHREEIERVQKAAQLEVASNGDRELIDAVAELQSEKAALEAKIRALSASTGSATASPTVSAAQLNDAIRDAQIQFEQRVVALKKAHREELERVEGMLARAKQDTSESPADNGELERLRSQLAAEVEKFDHVSEDLQRIMADDLAAKQSLRDANATIERLQSELTQAKQSSAPSSSGSSERRDDGEVERLRSQLAAEVDKFNHVSEDLERIMADDIEAKNALRNANLEIERLRDEVSRPTSVVNDEELVKAVAELQAELAAEVEKFNHISADLERIMVDDMAAKSALREANGTIERLQLELSEAKQTSSSSGTSASSSEVQRLQNELKAEIQKFDELSAELQRIKAGDLVAKDRLRQANSEIERLRADLNQPKQAASLNAQLNDAMRDAQIAFEQRVVALKKAHREELERVQKAAQGATASNGDRELIEAVAELQSEKAALEAKIRANVGANVSASQLNDAVREAQIAFEQRVVALKKAHREELERVEGMLARAKQDTSESPADNGELERLRSQLAAEVEKFDHVSEDLQRIMADDLAAKQSLRDANATIERLQSELTQAKQSSAPSSSGSSERRDDGEVERLRSQLAAEVDKFNHVSEDLERIMADDIEAKNALRNANLEIERLRDEVSRPTSVVNDEELVKAVAELQAELAAEVEKFNHISADLERIMVDDMAAKSALREANGTIERLQLELSEAKQTSSSSGTSASSSEVQRLQNELKAEIQKFDELSAELQRIKAGDLVAKDRLRQANSEIERLRADLNQPKQAASLNAQLNDAMRDAQIAFEQRVVALKKAHREELERVEGMLARAKQDTSESPADNGELERLRSQLAAEVEKFDHVSEDLQRIMADDLAAKQSLRDANATIERLQSELTQAKQSSAPSSSGSSERRDDGEVERLRSQLAAEVDKFNHVSEDLERIMADDIEAKNALRNANLEIERLRDEVSRPTSVVNDEELVKAVAELQAELAAEVEKFNHISADLERIMVDDMAAKSALREANGTIERLQLELSEAKQTSSSSGTSASSSEVQRLQNELKAEIQKFDELSAELQRIKAGDLVAKDRLRQANSEIERLRADLNQPKQAASLNAQLNDAMRDAQIAFEQRVVALKKAHREELERVEGMLARAKQDTSESPADNGELERLRSQLAAEVEKFDHVSEDLQRIMADDLAAKQSLRDANATIERLQSELTQAKQSSAPSSSGSSERRDDGEVERLRSQLAAEVDKFNHVSEDLERIMADDIEAKKALRNANLEIERLRADLNQPKQAASLNAQLNDAMRDAQIAFEQRVVALKKAHREELERVQKAAQGVTASNGDRELIEAVAELQSEKAALESKIRANVGASASASQLNDAVRDAQIAFEQRVVALKKAHREELERIKKAAPQASSSGVDREFVEAVAQLRSEKAELEDELRALNATVAANASATTSISASQLNDTLRDAQIAFEQRVVALKKAHQEEIERVQKAAQGVTAPGASSSEDNESELIGAVAELQSEKAELEAKIRALSASTGSATASPTVSAAQLNDAIRDAQIQFEQRVVALKKAHREELERVEGMLARAKQDTSESPADNGELERLRSQLAAEVEKFDHVSEDLQRIMADDLAAKQSLRDANATIERLQSELTQAKQSSAPSSSGSSERRDDGEVERLRSQLAAEVDKFNHVSEDLERIMADDIEAKNALRNANLEIERLRDEVSRPTSVVNDKELVKAVAELQAELAAEVEKFDQISADLERIMADDMDAKCELREANAEIDRLRREMSQAADAASTSDAEDEVERLRMLLASEIEKFDHVSGDLERIIADDLEAKSDLREANTEIERLKTELTTVTSKLLAENDQLKASAEEVTMNFDNSIRELEDLRLTVSKLTSDADLTQVIAELQSELAKRAAIESELRVQVDATKEELDALRSKKSDTVITLPKFVTYTFQGGSADSKQISKLEEKITMLESQLADMQKAKEQYDATIPPLKTTSSDVSPTAVTDSAQVDKLKRQLADQSKLLEAEKERAEKELVETTARMKLLAETDKAKYEAALQSNEKQLIEAVAELQSLAGSEKAELEASLKASRGERRQLYAMMRSELLKNAASSRVDFTAEVASAEARSSIYWEQKLKEAQEKSDAQLASLTQEYEVQIASLKTTKAGSGTSSDVATLQKQLDEVRQHAEQELVRAVAEIQASASADITAIRALVKSESDERFSKAENTFNEEKAALLKAHKAQIEALESSITGSLSQDEQMKLKAAEDEWKKKLQEVENSAKIRAQESAAEHESTVKRLEKQLSEVRDGYESTIKKLNKQLAQSASATEQELQRDLAQARDDLERFMRDQSSKTNTIVKYTLPESITYKFEGGVNEVKRIKSQRDALQKKLDRLEAEYASAGADSVIENRISELKAELESTRAERDRDVELLTNRFKTENAEVERRMQKQLEDARRSAETAEKKYKKDIGESGGWRFGLFGQGKVQDADVDALNDDMRNKASLLKAAEEELAESKNREDELRREAARLTSELEQAISNSSEEIDALKKEFSKNVEAASSNFAVDMKATVDKYETQIAKIKSMAEDEAIAVVAELKTEAQQEMVRAIAELNAEAQYELVQVVARLNEERDASIAAAETKYTLELKRTSEAAAGSASEEVITLTRALVKLEDEKRLLQMDVIAWKDQVKSYEEQLAKSEAARKDLLDKYQHSRSMLTNQLAKASELEQRYHDDMTQAIAQSMAEAAIEFNASLQESEKQTKEVQRQLASLTAELDARVRDAAKKENKRLRDREQELEKQIKRAQRDYANQARKMEKLAAQLETVQSEYKAAEENWSRSMRLMKVDFEQRLKKEQVTLAEKIAFYEQRVKSLTEELTLAKDQAKSASMRVKSESVAPTRPLFEFNRGKLAAEQAAREDAERQLLAAKSEMEALRTLLLAAEDEVEKAQSDLKISEINRSKEVAQARDQGARSVPLLQRLFGTPQKSARTPPTPKVVEKVVVQKSEDSTKVKALEDELAVAARKLSELKTDSRAEFESAKKKIREEYEAELKILQSKVASLEKALSRSDEIAKEKLAMATKAAQAEKDRMEKTLRAEITAAKSLAANAKLSAQRELSSVLRDAEARAKRDLREQAKRAADERAAAEAEIRANAKEANKKLKDKISKFETMLDERDLEIEAKFNAQFDKLVVDFRQEVEILQKSLRAAEKRSSGRSEPKVIEKIVEKVVKADVDGEAYATEIAKTKEDLAVLRKRSEDDMAKLRASYEERLREAIEAKDAALKESREEALKAVSSQKGKAEEQLKAELGEREKALKAEKALKQKLERDRENLERSFEKTVSQRDSYAREVKTLKASLAEAKRRLRDLVDMSDEELRVLEESKKVASELDELKTKYAESMGIAVSEVEDEDVAGLDITKIDTIVARRTKTRSRNKTAVDYFKQLLDMSKK